ncbi:polymerase [Mesorhizobium sp. M1C.F.Ca.ET.204.01.1.1]|nr:polymerase [Mesorhizobium sp. M1C.F.Ca.ET.204.01.1.1]
MQFGEIIANTFAAILVICGLALIFLVAGRPLFPRRHARMVVILPADQNTTASTCNTHPHLPTTSTLPSPRPGLHEESEL